MIKGKCVKKIFSKNNIIYFIMIGVFAFTQAPTIANNFKTQGTKLSTIKIKTVTADQSVKNVSFPPKGKSIAIFWSTTCAPCRLEMSRLKSSVEDGKIPQDSLFAINSFESSKEVKKFLKKNPHPFTFIQDPGIGAALNVRSTPTTIFIEDGEVVSMKSGVSFIGIWSAENFVKKIGI